MDAFAAAIPTQLDALWDFGAVAETQRKFEALLDEALAFATSQDAIAVGRQYPQVLEILTQIARTQGLQRAFDDAHATLDRVQRAIASQDAVQSSEVNRTALVVAPTRVSVRYHLERGRVFNSSKQAATALPLFVHAWAMAQQCHEDDLEVDAAHMVAIAEPTSEKQTEWNVKAIAKAEASTDPKARKWLGSLTNNLGWTYHGADKFEDALVMFEKALAFREQAGEIKSIVIARWCKARCLRSLGHIDEALAIQQALKIENEKLNAPDGYNSEEIGELLLLQGRPEEARPHFQRAAEVLGADVWFAENEKERLARLESLARGMTP